MEDVTTLPATSSAGEAATAEHKAIMTDPNHPMHAGFTRNDARVHDHIDQLYKKAYGSAPVQFGQGVEITSSLSTPHPSNTDPSQSAEALTPEARAAAMEFDSTLRLVLGDGYDEEMSAMRLGSARLLGTPETVKAFDALTPIITELGPHAEVAVVRFLSQIGRLTRK